MTLGQGMKSATAALMAFTCLQWQASRAQDVAAPVQPQAAPTPSQPDSGTQVVLDFCATALAEHRQGACIPALTPVKIELTEPLSSRTNVTGQTFALSLVSPLAVDGKDLIPAGTKGQGEVVHAKKTGVGVGGELVLAARFLQIGERRLRLRSMHLNGTGRDQQGLAFAVGVTVGLPALFVRGKHIDVPAGAFADAKTAEPFWVDVGAASTASSVEPASEDTPITKEGVPNVP